MFEGLALFATFVAVLVILLSLLSYYLLLTAATKDKILRVRALIGEQ